MNTLTNTAAIKAGIRGLLGAGPATVAPELRGPRAKGQVSVVNGSHHWGQVLRNQRHRVLGLVAAAVLPVVATAAIFTGLNDPAVPRFESFAYAVSADGAVLVGYMKGASDPETFPGTGGVMTGLGDPPVGQRLFQTRLGRLRRRVGGRRARARRLGH